MIENTGSISKNRIPSYSAYYKIKPQQYGAEIKRLTVTCVNCWIRETNNHYGNLKICSFLVVNNQSASIDYYSFILNFFLQAVIFFHEIALSRTDVNYLSNLLLNVVCNVNILWIISLFILIVTDCLCCRCWKCSSFVFFCFFYYFANLLFIRVFQSLWSDEGFWLFQTYSIPSFGAFFYYTSE